MRASWRRCISFTVPLCPRCSVSARNRMEVSGERRSCAMSTTISSPFAPASRDVKSCNQSGSIATRTRSMAVSAARTWAGAAAAADQLRITSDRSSRSRRWPSTERAAVSTTTSPATCCRWPARASASTIPRTPPWALPLSRSHAVTTRRAAAWSSADGTAANRSACGAGGYELRLRLRGADSGLGLGRVVIRTGSQGRAVSCTPHCDPARREKSQPYRPETVPRWPSLVEPPDARGAPGCARQRQGPARPPQQALRLDRRRVGVAHGEVTGAHLERGGGPARLGWLMLDGRAQPPGELLRADGVRRRSEERRVGKECRSRWSPYH